MAKGGDDAVFDPVDGIGPEVEFGRDHGRRDSIADVAEEDVLGAFPDLAQAVKGFHPWAQESIHAVKGRRVRVGAGFGLCSQGRVQPPLALAVLEVPGQLLFEDAKVKILQGGIGLQYQGFQLGLESDQGGLDDILGFLPG